ncbi:MAG: hypothetical protein QOJ83_213, partial [Frankiales bacterium]|nr:hypothetical protein [Frankiales bacterium]
MTMTVRRARRLWVWLAAGAYALGLFAAGGVSARFTASSASGVSS